MAEKVWIESDGVPLNKCPECGAFPEDPYDVECRSEAHPDREGPEFEEVLYVPKALLDERDEQLRRLDHAICELALDGFDSTRRERADAARAYIAEALSDERNAE